jgi:hypothetical protein
VSNLYEREQLEMKKLTIRVLTKTELTYGSFSNGN